MREKEKDPGFPDRLQRLMDKTSLIPSDLARLLWGESIDEKGRTTARNRQVISKYLSGKVYPSYSTRKKLAKVLEVSYLEFFPYESTINRPGSGITIKPIDPENVLLELHVTMPATDAWRIVELLLRSTARDKGHLPDTKRDGAIVQRGRSPHKRRPARGLADVRANRPEIDLAERSSLIRAFYQQAGGIAEVMKRTGVSRAHLHSNATRGWLNRTARYEYRMLALEIGFDLPDDLFNRPRGSNT